MFTTTHALIRFSKSSLVLGLALVSTTASAQNVAGINGAACGYGTIQGAITAASGGDTVYVAAGVYNEDLTIDKELDLLAATGNCTAAAAAGSHVSVLSGAPLTVIAPGEDVTITQFVFRDGTNANINSLAGNLKLVDSVSLLAGGRGINGAGGYLFMDNSLSWGNDGGGIEWGGSNTVMLQDSNVFDNTSADEGAGIRVRDGANLIIQGTSQIYDNTVDPIAANAGGGCIFAVDSDVSIYGDAEIHGCTSLLSPGGAMSLVRSDTSIRGNAVVRDSMADGDGGLVLVEGGTFDAYGDASFEGGSSGGYGGNVVIKKEGDATLRGNAVVKDGAAPHGGGVAVIGATGVIDAPSLTLTGFASIVSNEAQFDGGGIFVEDGNFTQLQESHIGDDENTPNRAKRGGGLFAGSSATVAIGTGSSSAYWFDIDASGVPTEGPQIRFNIATEAGGGVYLDGTTGETELTGIGAAIYHNKAVGPGMGDGGGIAAVGNGATVDMNNSMVSANRARVAGGGVYAAGAATVGFRSGPNPDADDIRCKAFLVPDFYCSEIRDNEAGRPADGTTGRGGGVYAADYADVNIARTALVGNRSQIDSAHLDVQSTAKLSFTNSLAVDVYTDADWTVTRGTLVNGRMDAAFSTFGGEGATVVYVPASGFGTFYNNVVWPDGQAGTGLFFGAFNVQPGALMPAANTGLLAGSPPVDPLFTSTWRGYYRLDAASPAIDQFGLPTSQLDLDRCSRSVGARGDSGAFEFGCP